MPFSRALCPAMLFNSLQFLLFFPVVTAIYFALPHRGRRGWLLAASFYFYMAFIPVYVFILLGTIVLDYLAGLWIAGRQGASRRAALIVSLVGNGLVLFVFKYFNFFNHNLAMLASALGWKWGYGGLSLILPIGLSFHTFQSMAYVIEVYRGYQPAERSFGTYALYVMFYPQLVAGPIERPQNLLHQFHEEKHFSYDDAVAGLRQMLVGFFKKVVVADRLALFVNYIYDNPTRHTGLPLMVATIFFAIQIYCDFSGYSDIAWGAARVMGFRLMRNFEAPYFSLSVSEFWRRWHISLSTWFKDYLYVSLGGSRCSVPRHYLNLLITFAVSGLWHGANWTYVAWGCLNGLYLIAGLITRSPRARLATALGLASRPRLANAVSMISTFALTCAAWVFFRARSISEAGYILRHAPVLGPGSLGQALLSLRTALHDAGFDVYEAKVALAAVVILLFVDVLEQRAKQPLGELLGRVPRPIRWSLYYATAVGLIGFGAFASQKEFIYFQF